MRALFLFLACFCGGFLIAYYAPLGEIENIVLVGVWSVGMGAVWSKFWPSARDQVQVVDLTDLTRRANLPSGWVVLAMTEMRDERTGQLVAAQVLTGNQRTRATAMGQGDTVDAALAMAAAEAARKEAA